MGLIVDVVVRARENSRKFACSGVLGGPSVRDKVHSVFFYKNLFYKNVEAEFCLKFKNILRTLPRRESVKNNFYSDQMFLNEQYKYG